ncbi:MAG: DUF1805 domain-containing protein [Elusimicrobiota bacterium]
MQVRDIVIKKGKQVAQGIEIPLQNSTLVLVVAKKGYIMCGYLDIATADKFDDCACVVRGVSSVDELLKSKVVEVSSKAKKSGIKIGMLANNALGVLS